MPRSGRARGSRLGGAAWTLAVALLVLLIALIAVSLAVGGGDDSSPDGSAGAGDQSFTSFGEQANPGDREAAASAVREFLRAQQANDAEGQCAVLATSTQRSLASFGGTATKTKKMSCPELVEAFRSRISPKVLAQADRVTATDVRVEGDRGFVIYRGARGDDFAFSVIREGSAWKAGAIAAYPVPKA